MKIISLLFLILPIFSYAQVYTWINKEGGRVYGDEPPAHANKAELPSIQEVNMPKIVQNEDSTKTDEENEFKGYDTLEIISPKEDHIITSKDLGKVKLLLHIQPELQPKDEIVLLLNGRIVQKSRKLEFELDSLNRGSHLLQLQVRNGNKALIISPKRRIHVQRPSILNRSRS
ncbi:hypothetical protein NBRC116188_14770 [Oceaniserpentilla sp. 4NH20-0058]|uniref:DUF4124 domain-containing protein n=1 Tax=Oceaniserpentilla sp. 4NH20-0058 TaxID=3127660 RepID=UPI0031079D84